MSEELEHQWLTRPLRHLTTREVESSLQDRKHSITASRTAMQTQFIQLEIEKPQAELDGRRNR